jgi:serine/threonine protein kinase
MASTEESKNTVWNCKLINDKYITLKNIGEGSYASVWLSYNICEKKYYAIKICNHKNINNGIKEKNIYYNFEKLNVPNVMKINEYFEYEYDGFTYYFCVMNLMKYSLFDHLKEYDTLPIDNIINISQQILLSLDAIHKNDFIHADLKPENILVDGISDKILRLINYLNLDSIDDFTDNNMSDLIEKMENYISDSDDSENYDSDNDENDNDENDNNENNDDNDVENHNNDDNKSDITNLTGIDYCSTNTETVIYDLNTTCYDTTISYDDEDDDNDENDENDDNDDDDNDDDNNNDNIIENVTIKLADMGTCVHINAKNKKKYIQTHYYRSPEILLYNGYTQKSDIWALGCSIYELLTGNTLFDAENIINEDCNGGKWNRVHLFDITQKLGDIPYDMKYKSPNKDAIFTSDLKTIRGFNEFNKENFYDNIMEILMKHNCDYNKKTIFVHFISKMLIIDPNNRYSANDLLNHPIFKL